MLASFLEFLEGAELITLDNIPNEDDAGFDTRFRIQKYVYLAKFFELDLGYNHGMYRYGPYSRRLADDYYSLTADGEVLPNTFDSIGFLNLIRDRDSGWLEIATTLLDQKPRFINNNDLVNHTESIKCNYALEYIRDVLVDLRNEELIL